MMMTLSNKTKALSLYDRGRTLHDAGVDLFDIKLNFDSEDDEITFTSGWMDADQDARAEAGLPHESINPDHAATSQHPSITGGAV